MIETLDDLLSQCTEPIEWFLSEDEDTVTVVALNGWVQEKLRAAYEMITATFPKSLEYLEKTGHDEAVLTIQGSGDPGMELLKSAELIAEWFQRNLPKGGIE